MATPILHHHPSPPLAEPALLANEAAQDDHVTLTRLDNRAGHLHVHFPRIGHVLKDVKA